MRNSVAKELREQARDNTIGYSERKTRQEYQRLKGNYKFNKRFAHLENQKPPKLSRRQQRLMETKNQNN